MVAEADALDDLAVAHVEAGDYAFGKYGSSSSVRNRCSSRARPLTTAATPVASSARRSSASRTPPDACHAIAGKRSHGRRVQGQVRPGERAVAIDVGAEHVTQRARAVAVLGVLQDFPQAARRVLLPAVRREHGATRRVVPHVECEHDAIRPVAVEPAAQLLRPRNGDAADHHPRGASRPECLERGLRADATADLQLDPGLRRERRDQCVVRRRPVARAVEVDDVHAARAPCPILAASTLSGSSA